MIANDRDILRLIPHHRVEEYMLFAREFCNNNRDTSGLQGIAISGEQLLRMQREMETYTLSRDARTVRVAPRVRVAPPSAWDEVVTGGTEEPEEWV